MRGLDGTPTRLILAALSFLLLLSAPAFSKVKLSVDVGWTERYRVGRWSPLYVTVSDSAPRQVHLIVDGPTDRRYAMRIYQSLAISPAAVTVPIYIPLSYRLDETTVTIRDANTNRLLESLPLADQFAGANAPRGVDDSHPFIGISGSSEGERMLQTQLSSERVTTSYLPPPRLPAAVVGYDSIDLLLLNQPDINRMSVDQQRAIAEWVRAGGLLVMWPGAQPLPASGHFIELLPCSIGDNEVLQLPPDEVKAAGLPARFATLKGRRLSDPAPAATRVPLLGEAGPAGYRHWVGFGQVMVLPADLSQLVFNSPENATQFWRQLLTNTLPLPATDDTASSQRPALQDAPADIQQRFDWIGDIPGAGSFGFSYIAGALIAMMLIVGPVDWFVLKWLGRQPWTWVTTSGWIGLITLSAIFLGHAFRSGEVHYRTATLIDEAGGSRVAAVHLAGIYSPQTTEYDLQAPPESWWRPATQTNSYGNVPVRTEIPCHQDYRGNRPMEMLINVWNLRSLEGVSFTEAPPLLDAKLRRSGNTLSGRIINRAAVPLNDVRVQTRDGMATLAGTIEPGATMDVSTTLAAPAFAAEAAAEQSHQQGATTRPTARILSSAAPLRSQRIDQILRDRSDVAAVYATFEAPPEDVSLKVEEMKQAHVNVVRALVPLE